MRDRVETTKKSKRNNETTKRHLLLKSEWNTKRLYKAVNSFQILILDDWEHVRTTLSCRRTTESALATEPSSPAPTLRPTPSALTAIILAKTPTKATSADKSGTPYLKSASKDRGVWLFEFRLERELPAKRQQQQISHDRCRVHASPCLGAEEGCPRSGETQGETRGPLPAALIARRSSDFARHLPGARSFVPGVCTRACVVVAALQSVDKRHHGCGQKLRASSTRTS